MNFGKCLVVRLNRKSRLDRLEILSFLRKLQIRLNLHSLEGLSEWTTDDLHRQVRKLASGLIVTQLIRRFDPCSVCYNIVNLELAQLVECHLWEMDVLGSNPGFETCGVE